MKNIIFSYLTAISVSMAMGSVAYTQTLADDSKSLLTYNGIIYSPEEFNKATDSGTHFLNVINARAARGFMREYKDISNEKWTKYEKGFIASFTKDSVCTRVFYNQRGDFEVMIRYYFENRLSGDIRRQVKSMYYDYSIFQISEVSRKGDPVYYIKIQDKTFWKTLRIENGEMEVQQEYSSARR